MRRAMSLAIACLLVGAGMLPAQVRFSPPVPDPSGGAPAPQAAPLPAPAPNSQAPQALGPPPAPALGPPPTAVDTPPSGPAIGPPPTPVYTPPSSPYYPGPYPPPPSAFTVPPYPRPWLVPGDPAGNPTLWVGVEALLMWTKNQPLPIPVITTGPASLGASAGNLGVPGTTSLNGPLHYGLDGGFRLFAGGWFDTDHTIGLSGSVFFLGQQSAGFGAVDGTGNGGFVINEPVAGMPFNTQVSAPGVATGGVAVDATSRLAGGDINLLYNLYRGNGLTINVLGGYRYLELDEWLTITGNSLLFAATTYTDGMGNVLATAPAGSTVTVIDQFGTRNQFSGGQLGVEFQYRWEKWFVGGTLKMAIGATHEVIMINGTTNVFPVGGTPVPLTGGNYASIQIGQYARNQFAVAPEAQLNVGYQFTPWLRGLVGYNFLWLSSVARPGNQIDNSYDGVLHPLVPMTGSSYWTQGFNFSLQFSY